MYVVSEIASQLTDYLNATICPLTTIAPHTDLLDAGVVDSLMIMELVSHMQATYGISITPGEIAPQNFRSVDNLSELIHSKLDKTRCFPTLR